MVPCPWSDPFMPETYEEILILMMLRRRGIRR